MKIAFTLLSSFLLTFYSSAQDYNFEWAHRPFDSILPNGVLANTMAGPIDAIQETARDVALDNSGNSIYITDISGNMYDFNGGYVTVYNSGHAHGVIQKRNSAGELLWHIYPGAEAAQGNQSLSIRDIAIADNNDIYISGTIRDSIDLDPGPGYFWLVGASSESGFMAHYAPDGTFISAIKIDGNSSAREIELDSEGNILLSGNYKGTNDFDPGAGQMLSTAVGVDDVYLLKLNASEQYVWHQVWGAWNEDDISGMVVDPADNIYVTGMFHDTLDFDPGVGIVELSPYPYGDSYISKFTPSGSFDWVHHFRSTNWAYIMDIDFDASTIAVSIEYYDSLEIDPYNNGPLFNEPFGDVNAVVVALDTTGNILWHYAPVILDSAYSSRSAYSIDAYNGEWFFEMQTGNSVTDLDNGPGVDSVIATGGSNLLLVSLSGSGEYQWYKNFQMPSGGGIDISHVAVNDDAIYLAGSFLTQSMDANPDTTAEYWLQGNFSYTGFQIKLDGCRDYETEIVSTCDSYTSPSGNYVWTSTGVYYDTLSNAYGCDSVITFDLMVTGPSFTDVTAEACNSYTSPSGNYVWTVSGNYPDTLVNVIGCDSIINTFLTINTVNSGISQVDDLTLTADVANAAYQWIDCATNTAISGATGQTYTASTNGNYAVIVTENNCTDTSTCMTIDQVGISDATIGSVRMYPNPTNGQLFIQLDREYNNVTIRVLDVLGREVDNKTYTTSDHAQMNIPGAAGTYFVEVSAENKLIETKHIVKQHE